MNHVTDKNYFTEEEQSCSCCGENKVNPSTLKRLNTLRAFLGFSLPASSMYRCPAHNKAKGYTQSHATGQCSDIEASHKRAYAIIKAAPSFGFTGIGVKQKGNKRFIHLDDLEEAPGRPRPHIWSY